MVAEDHANSKGAAQKVYDCIRGKLLTANGDHKLPIMYVMDSILKNARGSYPGLLEEDAATWMTSVYRDVPNETTRGKLKRVWKTWNDFSLFSSEDKWLAMGTCFDEDLSHSSSQNATQRGALTPGSASPISAGAGAVAGIPRTVRK